MNFTVKGMVLSDEEYLSMIKDAPLIRANGNTKGWVKILSYSPHVYFYFPAGLVQPDIDVQVGDVVHLAFEGLSCSARLVDWWVENGNET